MASTPHPTCFLNSKTCKHSYQKAIVQSATCWTCTVKGNCCTVIAALLKQTLSCCSILCTLWISGQPINAWQQQADVPNKAGVNVSCSTSMHAQVTGGGGEITCAQQPQVDHQEKTRQWEVEASPQAPVDHVVNKAHTCPSIRLFKACAIKKQTLLAANNLQSEGTCI